MSEKKAFHFDRLEYLGIDKDAVRRNVEDPCTLCGLHKGCNTPRMEVSGSGKKKLFILGEAPDSIEDKEGRAFVGDEGVLLTRVFSAYGLSVRGKKSGAWFQNVCQCRTEGGAFNPAKAIYCYERLEEQIKARKPKVVACMGQWAATRMLETKIVTGVKPNKNIPYSNVVGDYYWSNKYRCWIILNFHPAAVLGNKGWRVVFERVVEQTVALLSVKPPKQLIPNGTETLLGKKEGIRKLRNLSRGTKLVSFDYETNSLTPYLEERFVLKVISVATSPSRAYVIPIGDDEDVQEAVRDFLVSPAPKVVQNSKYEYHCSRRAFDVEPENVVWDTMLAGHIIDERKVKTSLAYLLYRATGEEYKDSIDVVNFNHKIKSHVRYSGLDSRSLLLIKSKQEKILKREGSLSAHQYQLRTSWALSRMENRGIRVDRGRLKELKKEVYARRATAKKFIYSNPRVKKFEAKHRELNLNSDMDLRDFFFKHLGFEPLNYTEKGTEKVDEAFFNFLRAEDEDLAKLVDQIQQFKYLATLANTFIPQAERYMDSDGYIHCSYGLNVCETQRSNCRNPNLQNPPTRNKYQRKYRSVFVPTNDFFVEGDYEGAELTVSAIRSQDPQMIKDIQRKLDIHKYFAKKLYPGQKIDKALRYNGKNGFVFPLLYGSYYKNIARALGLPADFAKEREAIFWERYQVTKKYQEGVVRKYDKVGYLELPFGFRRRAPLSRNQIKNTDIQGPTFFLLADTMYICEIALMQSPFLTCQRLQVHDSILYDVKAEEWDEVRGMSEEAFTQKGHLGWVPEEVPLGVEWETGCDWEHLKSME